MAFRDLAALGDQAEPALRVAFKTAGPLELRRRLERLLADIDHKEASAEWLRQLRALQILELADSAQARELLHGLANGAPGARLTRAAQAACDRLAIRAKARDAQ
jgi:hypothetical protein